MGGTQRRRPMRTFVGQTWRAMNTSILGIAAAVVAAGLATTVAFAVTPISGGSVGGPTTGVDTSPGEQIDPHVSGNLAAYTDQAIGLGVIRYYDFLNPG